LIYQYKTNNKYKNTMKTFIVKIKTNDNEDFCESDLHEAISDGLENVGNFELVNLEIDSECERCSGEMRIEDYENGYLYSDDGKMPCPDCQGG
jgi:hypothetical protein